MTSVEHVDQSPADLPQIDHQIGVGMGGACPTCSAPVDLSQEFCLECGSPVRAGKKARTGEGVTASGHSFPWIPFVVVLALVAFGVTTALLADNSKKSTTTTTESSESDAESTDTFPTVPTTPTETTPTDTVPTTSTDPTTVPTTSDSTNSTDTSVTTDTSTATSTTTDTSATTWPDGKSGYTVVLQSLNKSAYSESDANQRAQDARDKNLTAGVLDSDKYSSLTTGLWVVYAGVFDTEDQANAYLPTVRSASYPTAFVRQISP